MKQTLTFYRKMANSNVEIMKKYKSSVINKMSYDELVNIYITNNIEFDQDIERIKNVNNKLKTPIQLEITEESVFEPLNVEEYISNSENNSEPRDIISETVVVEAGEIVETVEEVETVEAVKTVSDLFLPVAGTVTEVNTLLEKQPELVNSDAYGDGWMVKMTVSNPADVAALMSSEAYAALVG